MISPAHKGFTLIELMVVVSIIAVLAVIGLTVFTGLQRSARDAKRKADIEAIATALEIYKDQHGTYSVATSFPCAAGTWWDFSSSAWGASGSVRGCPASIGNGLASSFAAGIPTDPFCSSTGCSNGWSNYVLSEPTNNGTEFTLYARLENPPANPCPGAPRPYNYCLSNQQ